MSETDTDTAGTLADQAREAYFRGDMAEAQRLNARAVQHAEPDEAEPAPEQEPEAEEPEAEASEPEPEGPEPFSDTDTRWVFQALRDVGCAEEELGELAGRWGNDANANFAYAREFIQRVIAEAPALGEAVDAIAAENPGFHLGLIELSARLGRESRHGGISAVEILQKEMGNMGEQDMVNGAAEIERLTEEAHRAMQRGRGAEAQKLFSQREKLAKRLYGDEPIVDGTARTA